MVSSPERLTDRIVGAGILVEGENRLTLSDEFAEARRDVAENTSGDDLESTLSLVRSRTAIGETNEVSAEDLAITTLTVDRFVDDVSDEARLAIALSLVQFDSRPGLDELPEAFVPLRGFEIAPYVRNNPYVVTVFWRGDCDPCEAVMADLQKAVEELEIGDAVELTAVYGPACSEYIRGEYSVGGAPTTLFFEDGAVTTRLLGRGDYLKIRRELEILVE